MAPCCRQASLLGLLLVAGCAAADGQTATSSRAAPSDSHKWEAEVAHKFEKLRRTFLAGGEQKWSESTLKDSKDVLQSAIKKRCARFFDRKRFRHEKMVFTHVPKTAGQALQNRLYEEMQRARLNPSTNLISGHIRYGDVRQWKRSFMAPPNEPDLITVVREPRSLILSNFAFMQRTDKHSSHGTAQKFGSLGEYLQKELDDGAGDGFALFHEMTRENKTLETLRAQCVRARFRGKDSAGVKGCSATWSVFFKKAAVLLARRYAVVGVLERLEDSLAVARCRVPWLRNLTKLPERNKRPDDTSKPTAEDNALLDRKTFIASQFYKAANAILDADLECCRNHRPKWMDTWWEDRQAGRSEDRSRGSKKGSSSKRPGSSSGSAKRAGGGSSGSRTAGGLKSGSGSTSRPSKTSAGHSAATKTSHSSSSSSAAGARTSGHGGSGRGHSGERSGSGGGSRREGHSAGSGDRSGSGRSRSAGGGDRSGSGRAHSAGSKSGKAGGAGLSAARSAGGGDPSGSGRIHSAGSKSGKAGLSAAHAGGRSAGSSTGISGERAGSSGSSSRGHSTGPSSKPAIGKAASGGHSAGSKPAAHSSHASSESASDRVVGGLRASGSARSASGSRVAKQLKLAGGDREPAHKPPARRADSEVTLKRE